VTLGSYLRIFRERWKLIALMVLLGIGVATVITAVSPKVYKANVQVFVSFDADAANTPTAAYAGNAALTAEVATFAELIDTPKILQGIQKDLNLSLTNSQLKGKISAEAPTTQTLVLIHATDGSPSAAAAIANSAASQFVKFIQEVKTSSETKQSQVRLFVTQPATAPSSPDSPNAIINIALGVVLGLLIGVGLAIARDVLDNRIRDVEVLGKTANQPVMGTIVEDPVAVKHPIATRAGTRNIRAENFRQLRANLQFANVDEHPRVIAITSSVPNEGKTMVAMNLASTLAEIGFTVCLVDADLRRPTVAKMMGLPSPVGLTSVLINQIDLNDALQKVGTNLYVLSSGPTPPNPSEVLASSYVRETIRALLVHVDYVVIDTAPLLPVADGAEVAALADGALLVARYNMTTDSQVKRAVAALRQVDAKLVGVVMNRIPTRRASEYGYTYYRTEKSSYTHASNGAEPGTSRRGQRSTVKEGAKS
jgi:capsular exopolysaccharide synthesis family protein